MNRENQLKIDFLEETGGVFNIYLKESVDNDRIESKDKDGKVTIYPSLDFAAESLSDGDKAKKATIKFKIRSTILQQDNKKICKKLWRENERDYLKRI